MKLGELLGRCIMALDEGEDPGSEVVVNVLVGSLGEARTVTVGLGVASMESVDPGFSDARVFALECDSYVDPSPPAAEAEPASIAWEEHTPAPEESEAPDDSASLDG